MLVGVAAFLGSEVVLSPVVSGCIPSCGGWVLVGVAASRTKIFRNQNHRFQSNIQKSKSQVYAGVIFLINSVRITNGNTSSVSQWAKSLCALTWAWSRSSLQLYVFAAPLFRNFTCL